MNFADTVVAELEHLRAYARHLTRHRERTEDLVQDTIERALIYERSYTPGTKIRAWLFTLMKNLHTSNLRHYYVTQRHAERIKPAITQQEATQHHHCELMETLGRMTPIERSALVDQALGYSYTQMAQQRGVPQSTMKSRVSRGRMRLMERVG